MTKQQKEKFEKILAQSPKYEKRTCEHAIPGTAWPGIYRGFEICPHCGKIARMGTKFIEPNKKE